MHLQQIGKQELKRLPVIAARTAAVKARKRQLEKQWAVQTGDDSDETGRPRKDQMADQDGKAMRQSKL